MFSTVRDFLGGTRGPVNKMGNTPSTNSTATSTNGLLLEEDPIPSVNNNTGHRRPLPPPETRDHVLEQLKGLSDWQLIDDDEDLRIIVVPKRKRSPSPGQCHISGSDINGEFLNKLSPPCKKRLIISESAKSLFKTRQIKNEDDDSQNMPAAESAKSLPSPPTSSSSKGDSTSQLVHNQNAARVWSTAFVQDSSDDDQSHEVDESHQTPSFNSDNSTPDVHQEELSRFLTKRHRHASSEVRDSQSGSTLDAETDDTAHQRQLKDLKIKEEAEYAERSRLLRERKLANRARSRDPRTLNDVSDDRADNGGDDPFDESQSEGESSPPKSPVSSLEPVYRQLDSGRWLCPLAKEYHCLASFLRKDVATSHMHSHTGAKSVTCSVCGTTYTRRYRLAAHMRKSHSMRYDASDQDDDDTISSLSKGGDAKHRHLSVYEPADHHHRPKEQAYEDDADQIERDLDIAVAFAESGRTSPEPMIQHSSGQTSKGESVSAIHPASRLVAERFRTQARHIEANSSKQDSQYQNLEVNEACLRMLAAAKPVSTIQSSQRPTFYGFEAGPEADMAQGDTSADYENVDVSTSSSGMSARPTDDPESTNSTPTRRTMESVFPKPNGLELLVQHNSRQEAANKKSSIHKQPDLPIIPLGTQVDIDIDNEDEVRTEHERLKEQQKDLLLIASTFRLIATLRAIGRLEPKEEGWLREVRKFVSVVVDEHRSGCERRKRIQDIRSNFSGKVQKETYEPSDEAIDEWYVRFLTHRRIEAIQNAQENVDEYVNSLKTIRHTLTSKRNNVKKHKAPKKVKFADQVEGSRRKTPEDSSSQPKKAKSRPLPKHEQKIADIKAALAKFEAARNKPSGDTTETPAADEGDKESVVSEEDEGEELLVRPDSDSLQYDSFTDRASRAAPALTVEDSQNDGPNLDEINRLESERQQLQGSESLLAKSISSASSQVRGGQRFDAELLKQMQKTSLARELEAQATMPQFDDIDDIAELESDSDSDSPTQASTHTHQYSVWGQFVGIDTYDAESDYGFGTFFDLAKANGKVVRVLNSLMDTFQPEDCKIIDVQTRVEEGLYQQLLTMPSIDARIQARIWVDKELIEISIGKLVTKAARRKLIKLTRTVSLYVVEWERTITTTVAVIPPSSGSGASAVTVAVPKGGLGAFTVESTDPDDESTSLFGSPPPPAPHSFSASPAPAPTTSSTTTSVTIEHSSAADQQYFSAASLANLAASKTYLLWYEQFFPASERAVETQSYRRDYSGLLGHFAQGVEKDLERLGNWGLGVWEDEVARKGETGEEVVEKMKVRVVEVDVKGPRN